ncbi:hypothetical protein BDZ89DRAFT_212169 [Hymenopellis radicata]|nr:hypothetical protein BDZ89DRAFT_212169 [Hymenopellis radicata]
MRWVYRNGITRIYQESCDWRREHVTATFMVVLWYSAINLGSAAYVDESSGACLVDCCSIYLVVMLVGFVSALLDLLFSPAIGAPSGCFNRDTFSSAGKQSTDSTRSAELLHGCLVMRMITREDVFLDR